MIPTTYTPDEISRVEASVDTNTTIEKISLAIIRLASRMGLRAGGIAKCIGCSFFVLGVKTVLFFLCAVERYSIIKLVFLHKIKSLNRMIGKPDESLGRKATGPAKWQLVA